MSSASASRSLSTCDVTITVRPAFRTSRILSLSTALETGSRPDVGSSSTSSFGPEQERQHGVDLLPSAAGQRAQRLGELGFEH